MIKQEKVNKGFRARIPKGNRNQRERREMDGSEEMRHGESRREGA